MSTESRRFEFASKSDRNAFLRRNNLCIAGSLNSWPNVMNQGGEFVGDAFQLRDGRHHIEVWAQFLHCVVDVDTVDPANDVDTPGLDASRVGVKQVGTNRRS